MESVRLLHQMKAHPAMSRPGLRPVGYFERVCRAWHQASRVPVPTPGVCRAEGEPKGKGAAARLVPFTDKRQ